SSSSASPAWSPAWSVPSVTAWSDPAPRAEVMEFSEVLRRRRMVRNYTDEPIEPLALERVARAALRAPSAGYSQGLALVVVTDAAIRHRLAEAAGESEYVIRGFDPWISRAPAHIIPSVSEQAYHRRYRMPDKVDEQGEEIEWPVPYWWVDAGAGLMAILLAAVDEASLPASSGPTPSTTSVRSSRSLPNTHRSGSLPWATLPPTVV